MKIYFLLLMEFFKIGLFSVGGGYATMPFLYNLITDYGWYSYKDLSDMIAISVLTPGPIGLNMATFAGFQTSGVTGAIVTSLALMLPTYIIVCSISKLLKTFKDSFWIKSALVSLKPAGCGLLTVVGINLFRENVQTLTAFLLFAFLFALSFKFKKNPLFYFLFAGIIGVILQEIHVLN